MTPRLLVALLSGLVQALITTRAAAETWQAPVGGKPIAMEGRVVCPGATADWTVDGNGAARPPTDDGAIGKTVDVKVAPSSSACGVSTTVVTLVATAKWPAIDASTVSLSVDEGRLDLRGRGLRGLGVAFRGGAITGEETCPSPQLDGAVERCVLPVTRGMPAEAGALALSWFPAGGRAGDDVVTFDASGRRASSSELLLHPARILVTRLLGQDAALDLTAGGAARVALLHPEAVTSADCGAATCEIENGALVVRRLQSVGTSLSVRLRLAPRILLARGEVTDAAPTVVVPILPCALTIASGDVVRASDDARIVVRLDARCARDAASLRFVVGGKTSDVLSTTSDGSGTLSVLRVGRVDGDEVSVVASRTGQDSSVVGQTRLRSRAVPLPRVSLQLDDGRDVDFIPQNRAASVRYVRDAGGGGVLDVLPIEGAVRVQETADGTSVVAEKGAGGFVALRFAYRVPSLPGALGKLDLAVLTEPVQRSIREAAVGLPLLGKEPLAELLCEESEGRLRRLAPGQVEHVAFTARDTCRIVLHRERIEDANGPQRIAVEIDVLRVDGSPRPEAHVSQTIVLRKGSEPRVVWVKGAIGRFDRVTIRLTQSADEERSPAPTDAVSAQWGYVTGTERARLYATTAIPTGLYRVSDRAHSGIMTLNFGVVSRLTWLDAEGHEGFLGLEAGMMGVGLANDVSPSGRSLTQAALVTGIGLSVPIANRSLATETSINLHAWFEYEVSRDLGNGGGSPFAFVFGPSISIGNIGTNL